MSFPYVVESLNLSVGVGKDVLLIDPHGCDEMHMLHWYQETRDGCVVEIKVASLRRWMS